MNSIDEKSDDLEKEIKEYDKFIDSWERCKDSLNKHLGCFLEGKYNKYWNRKWYDFKFGMNYVIF